MNTKRLFIAIKLPPNMQEMYYRVCDDLRNNMPEARCSAPDTLHLTLAFLGAIPDDLRFKIQSVLADIAYASFSIKLTKLGLFKTNTHAIVYIEAISEQLNSLSQNIRDILDPYVQLENRTFVAHITLLRLNGYNVAELERMTSQYIFQTVSFRATSFVLLESHLSQQGSHYTPIESYPLH